MKNKIFSYSVSLCMMSALLLGAALSTTACASTKVTRVDAETQTDLTGYWNDTDVRIVCESLIADCLASPRLQAFQTQNGRLPVFIVGTFSNNSSEHIDTAIISKRMEAAILNSGKADFVASSSERGEMREERMEQQSWASEETAKSIANETGADFMMTGGIRTIVERLDNTTVRTYYVTAELTDLESSKKIWIGENSEIKKIIKSSSVKL